MKVRPLPDTYRIKITVEAEDNSGVGWDVELEGIKRSDILAPDYRNDGIADLVRNLDYFYYGVGTNPFEDEDKEKV